MTVAKGESTMTSQQVARLQRSVGRAQKALREIAQIIRVRPKPKSRPKLKACWKRCLELHTRMRREHPTLSYRKIHEILLQRGERVPARWKTFESYVQAAKRAAR
jgi:hypothetical protein